MAQNKTKYFEKMMGGPMTPHSIVILGNQMLNQAIIRHAYINFLFGYLQGMKIELWEDRAWLDLKYRKMLKSYHEPYMKHYRPTQIFERENKFDHGIRKLYDEFVPRRSNRHSQIKKIIYVDNYFMTDDKPRNAMVEEILKDGGKKCNIQYIANAIKGTGEIDTGLLRKFDIRIATLPLGKKDSIALFGTDKYASKKEEDFIYFGYKNDVEKVPIFHHNVVDSSGNDFLELIRTWTF